jgi:peptidoglycan/LPS O-acetylase OafA/YrhL
MASRRDHLVFLDQLRGLAIIFVFVYHTLYQPWGRDELAWSGWTRNFDAPTSFLWMYPVSWGWCGVAIFFALSGFCIQLSHAKTSQPSSVEFLLRRWFRIYPPFLVALIFFAFVFPRTRLDMHTRMGLAQFFSHLLLLHNLNGKTEHGIAVAWWSIAVEFQLYLLYPLLFSVARRFSWRAVLTGTAIIELGLRAGCEIYMLKTGQKPWAIIWLSPFYFWFSWAVGAALADAWMKGQPLPFARYPTLLWVGLLILADLFRPLNEFSFTFASLATVTVIAHFLNHATPTGERRTVMPGWLARSLALVGVWSYSIYLIHHPIVESWPTVVNLALPSVHLHPLLMYLCCLSVWLLILVAAWAMHRWVELPAIAIGKRAVSAWQRRRGIVKPIAEAV